MLVRYISTFNCLAPLLGVFFFFAGQRVAIAERFHCIRNSDVCNTHCFYVNVIIIICIQPLFREHAISSGWLLMRLEESHLKEMGVSKVGHRFCLVQAIRQLRKDAGLFDTRELGDLHALLTE